MNHKVLLDAITPEEKEVMNAYITTYGAIDEYFIGLDKWLQFWSYSKQKLFKLLGGKLIHKEDFTYEKERDTLISEVRNKLLTLDFKKSYHNFFIDVIRKYWNEDKMDIETKNAFSSVTDSSNFIDDKITRGIRWKKPGAKSMLQLQPGMKPIRALQKIINYFKDDYTFEGFEEFRVAHSMILNDRYIKGKLCFSIHPMDFITMSDNASDWSSCMSWKTEGCYHLGTVEMMNSNNVVCCYIQGREPFTFKDHNGTTHCWNNKKFRVLFYVTKDIIVNGKSYPYENISVVKSALEALKKLAKENWNRDYSFGPELYKDMIHVNYGSDMERNKEWIMYNNTKKHNIIFDTKAMYNDMFNDNNREYWCYRNKVKRNKVISISGKANCLCCNNTVWYDSEEVYDYNDRYREVGQVVCNPCRQKKVCSHCSYSGMRKPMYKVIFDGVPQTFCKECFDRYVRICPDCGKPFMWLFGHFDNRKTGYFFAASKTKSPDYVYRHDVRFREINPVSFDTFDDFMEERDSRYDIDEDTFIFEQLIFHHGCGKDITNNSSIVNTTERSWGGSIVKLETRVVTKEDVYNKYSYWNLKRPEYVPEMRIETSNNHQQSSPSGYRLIF